MVVDGASSHRAKELIVPENVRLISLPGYSPELNPQEIHMGPLSSKPQFEKVLRLISQGIEEGAKLITGGLGRPHGISKGYFVKPTVFADVQNRMTHGARADLRACALHSYEDENDAIRIANDTPMDCPGS